MDIRPLVDFCAATGKLTLPYFTPRQSTPKTHLRKGMGSKDTLVAISAGNRSSSGLLSGCLLFDGQHLVESVCLPGGSMTIEMQKGF